MVVRGHSGSGYGKRHCMRKVQVSGMQASLLGPGQKSASSSESKGHHYIAAGPTLPRQGRSGPFWGVTGGCNWRGIDRGLPESRGSRGRRSWPGVEPSPQSLHSLVCRMLCRWKGIKSPGLVSRTVSLILPGPLFFKQAAGLPGP